MQTHPARYSLSQLIVAFLCFVSVISFFLFFFKMTKREIVVSSTLLEFPLAQV